MRGLRCRSSIWGKKSVVWICSFMFYMAGGESPPAHSTFSVSPPHLYQTCPEGATAKLVCSQRGAGLLPTDVVKHGWLFTPHSDQHCTGRMGPRHITIGSHSHDRHSLPPGLQVGYTEQNFWLTLQNVTHADQGRYCCVAQVEHKQHDPPKQRPHSHIILQITPRRNGSQDCTVWDPTPPEGSVPVALAVAACVLALFSMPLILLLVYKQRQSTRSSRRAQELVRMDSEAQGHENPMYLRGSPQIKTRTVSQIMTRQPSETGRHLLSEPGTPLTPPAHGDVFFPIEDTILESPEFLRV
ncbi:V-type immunoglobulin domain-containing suppressor of T-cell activation [Brachionichthys hirsutus]|uniref:V-type immunoglobulin domain-containing suppressor of T-cell activation n=1 Tax=Brachionichthys hirsutus TaxID=412623 RepID=UPI003604FF7D